MTKTRRGRPRGAAGVNGGNGGNGGNGDPPRQPSRDALPEEARENLRRLLDERGLSGTELARRMGVTQATASRWLTGDGGMPFGTLRRLAEVLEVPYSAILVPGATAQGDTLGLLRQIAEREGVPLADTDPAARITRRDLLDAVAGLRDDVAQLAGALGGLHQLLAAHEARLDTLEPQWRRSWLRGERLQQLLRAASLYQQGHRGDPRRGEGDPEAGTPLGVVQLPAGAERVVGPRGFAVWVNSDAMSARGVRHGDVAFCNPDAPWGDGSLCAVGLPEEDGTPGAPAERARRWLRLNLRELGHREDGSLEAVARAEGEERQPYAHSDFVVYGPVVLVQLAVRLPEGRGHLRDVRLEAARERTGRTPDDTDPQTGQPIRFMDGDGVGTEHARPPR